MKKETRGRVKRFLTSESGRVGIRAPLALGIVSGALLLSQAEYTTTNGSSSNCSSDADCGPGEKCTGFCAVRIDGTCRIWSHKCV